MVTKVVTEWSEDFRILAAGDVICVFKTDKNL